MGKFDFQIFITTRKNYEANVTFHITCSTYGLKVYLLSSTSPKYLTFFKLSVSSKYYRFAFMCEEYELNFVRVNVLTSVLYIRVITCWNSYSRVLVHYLSAISERNSRNTRFRTSWKMSCYLIEMVTLKNSIVSIVLFYTEVSARKRSTLFFTTAALCSQMHTSHVVASKRFSRWIFYSFVLLFLLYA